MAYTPATLNDLPYPLEVSNTPKLRKHTGTARKQREKQAAAAKRPYKALSAVGNMFGNMFTPPGTSQAYPGTPGRPAIPGGMGVQGNSSMSPMMPQRAPQPSFNTQGLPNLMDSATGMFGGPRPQPQAQAPGGAPPAGGGTPPPAASMFGQSNAMSPGMLNNAANMSRSALAGGQMSPTAQGAVTNPATPQSGDLLASLPEGMRSALGAYGAATQLGKKPGLSEALRRTSPASKNPYAVDSSVIMDGLASGLAVREGLQDRRDYDRNMLQHQMALEASERGRSNRTEENDNERRLRAELDALPEKTGGIWSEMGKRFGLMR